MGQLHSRLSIPGFSTASKGPVDGQERKEKKEKRRASGQMKPKPKGGKAGKTKSRTAGGEALDLAPYDHSRHCPQYSRLLERGAEEEAVGPEDLDPLQAELETLLLVNCERQRRLAKALDSLAPAAHPWADRMEVEAEDAAAAGPSASKPRKDLKLKIPADASANGSGERTSKAMAKEQIADLAAGEEAGNPNPGYQPVPITDRRGRKRVYFWPQNHMPDKFWSFVEGYTAAVTDEDLKELKDLIRSSTAEKNRRFFQLHPDVWTKAKAPSNGSASNGNGRKGSKRKLDGSPEARDGERRPSKSERKSSRLSSGPANGSAANGAANGDSGLGPLTERLVQALVEDQSSASPDYDVAHLPGPNGLPSPNKALVKSLSLGNTALLERRIRRELEEQGLLEPDQDDDQDDDEDDDDDDDDVDEVSRELSQREKELRGIMEANRLRLTALKDTLERAAEEARLRPDLADADQHLLDLYNRFYSTLPRRKPSTKKERDALADALRQRRSLLQRIDALRD